MRIELPRCGNGRAKQRAVSIIGAYQVWGEAHKPHCGHAGVARVWDTGRRPLQHWTRRSFLGPPRCPGPLQVKTGRSAATGAGCCSLTRLPSQALPRQHEQSTQTAGVRTGCLRGSSNLCGQQTHLARPRLQRRPQQTMLELKAGLQAATQSGKQEIAMQQGEGERRQAVQKMLRPCQALREQRSEKQVALQRMGSSKLEKGQSVGMTVASSRRRHHQQVPQNPASLRRAGTAISRKQKRAKRGRGQGTGKRQNLLSQVAMSLWKTRVHHLLLKLCIAEVRRAIPASAAMQLVLAQRQHVSE